MDNIKITPLLDTLKLQKISDQEYFSEHYKNYISNSRLGLINPEQNGSPEKFFQGFQSGFNISFKLGSGVHCGILQPDLFNICTEVNEPTAKMGALADLLYRPFCENSNVTNEDVINAAKKVDYYKGVLSIERINKVIDSCKQYWSDRQAWESSTKNTKEQLYFDEKSRNTVLSCINALNQNKTIYGLLYPECDYSETEQAILLDIKVEINNIDPFILRLKSKLDHYSIDPLTNTICVNDVKTIGKVVSEMPNNIAKFHYNREIAMYSWLLSLCAKKFYNINNPTVRGNYLVVSTIPSYYTKVIPMTKRMFYQGWNEFVFLLKLVAKEVATNYREFGIW